MAESKKYEIAIEVTTQYLPEQSDPDAERYFFAYTITVTNQGSADGTGIQIVADLEDTQQYVSSTGPTAGAAKGQTITFAPLAKLAPKASVSWTIKVKAVKTGDVRFKTTMTSDQISRPVEETEATNQYE